MIIAKAGLLLVVAVGLTCLVLAAAAIWLLLAQPVSVATALSDGAVAPIAKAMASLLIGIVRSLAAWL